MCFKKRGRVLKLGKAVNSSGYLYTALGSGARIAVHVAVCSAFHGKRKKSMVVNHKNGIKTDNRSSNLEWLSYRDNTIYGRRFLGKIGKRFNIDFAKGILLRVAQGAKVVTLAEELGVSRQYVSNVLNGRDYPSSDYPELGLIRARHPYKSPTHRERSEYRRGPLPFGKRQ